eukprot:319478-Alexandrium_andersonii.AAC.1
MRNNCCHDLGGCRSPAMAATSFRAAARSRERRSGAVPLAAPKSKLRMLIGRRGPARPQEGRAARGRRRT